MAHRKVFSIYACHEIYLTQKIKTAKQPKIQRHTISGF